MNLTAYAETMEEGAVDARGREREALGEAIRLLQVAEQKGRHSTEAVEALHYVRRLWSLLVEDLGRADNGLPQSLRAGLISIGIWVLREAERIRTDQSDDFPGLIDINSLVRDGLA